MKTKLLGLTVLGIFLTSTSEARVVCSNVKHLEVKPWSLVEIVLEDSNEGVIKYVSSSSGYLAVIDDEKINVESEVNGFVYGENKEGAKLRFDKISKSMSARLKRVNDGNPFELDCN